MCFFSRYGDHRDLHSFPTRRSSDLLVAFLQNGLPIAHAETQVTHLIPYPGLIVGIQAQHIFVAAAGLGRGALGVLAQDRKSTRLNSSHLGISYAVFCLKKKKHKTNE